MQSTKSELQIQLTQGNSPCIMFSAAQLAPLTLQQHSQSPQPGSTYSPDAVKVVTSHTATATFSEHGKAMVQPAAGGSHNLLVTELVKGTTVTVEWDPRQFFILGRSSLNNTSK